VQRALGRSPGAPLFIASQKSITGHPKGGAAAFQIAGACQAMRTGVIPGNRNLDTVDPSAYAHGDLVFTDAPVAVGRASRVDAAVITSLGFGHVSAFALLLHPDAFAALLEDPSGWAEAAAARRVQGQRQRERILAGLATAFEKRTDPGFGHRARHAAETAMLLDPAARWDIAEAQFRVPKP
jgi:fatty acid synthase